MEGLEGRPELLEELRLEASRHGAFRVNSFQSRVSELLGIIL
jgi:hypothetical protein